MGSELNNNTSNSITLEAAIRAVQELPDLNEDLLLEAFDFLDQGNNAIIFVTMQAELRRKWLLRKLRPQRLKIIVKNMDDERIKLNVLMSDTIEEVKAKICGKTGYLARHTGLAYMGKQLEDAKSVVDYNILDGSSIHLLCLCGC